MMLWHTHTLRPKWPGLLMVAIFVLVLAMSACHETKQTMVSRCHYARQQREAVP